MVAHEQQVPLPQDAHPPSLTPGPFAMCRSRHLAGNETGRQVVTAMRELQGPTFKAIVVTGDTFAAVHAFDGEPFLCWLRKPVDLRQLTTILEKFLAEDPQNEALTVKKS